MPENTITFELHIAMPNGGPRYRLAFDMDRIFYQESFAPLPRDRELPFATWAHQEAAEKRLKRRHYAEAIAATFAAKLLDMVEAEDPQFGYSPEEWRQIQRLGDAS